MAAVLHLLGGNDPARALPVIAGQVAAGDRVTVAVVGGTPPPLPSAVTVRRVPGELSYDQLLDLVFTVDQVISW